MFVETEKRPAGDFPLSRENDSKTPLPWQSNLLEIANRLEKFGWCQHDARDHKGRMCIVGAAPIEGFQEAMRRLDEAVGSTVIAWNNAPGRTQEEVVAKLRAVALGL